MRNLQSENPSGAGNEQGRPTKVELAWLAGHFDGDGWIGIFRARRSNSQHLRYSGAAVIATTSVKLKDHIHDLLERLEVKHSLIRREPRTHQRKVVWHISIGGNRSSHRFLTTIRPYLVEKAEQAALVIQYVEWREKQPKQTGGAKKNQPMILGMKEYAEDIMVKLTADRRRDVPSTTTRLAPDSSG